MNCQKPLTALSQMINCLLFCLFKGNHSFNGTTIQSNAIVLNVPHLSQVKLLFEQLFVTPLNSCY